MRKTIASILCVLLGFIVTARPLAAEDSKAERDSAQLAMRKAIGFFSEKVASHGGFLYRYSADLSKREGEGKAAVDTVWVQPPGTPSVGQAFLDAYVRTGDALALKAAKAAADCLVRGQLRSGGWTDRIDFGDDLRPKNAYRVDAKVARRGLEIGPRSMITRVSRPFPS